MPETLRDGRVTLYLDPECADGLDRADLLRLPRIVAGLPGCSSRQRGRVTLWRWRPHWHEGPGLVVRQYAHGGALGPLRGALFLGAGRMRREFETAMLARHRAVPTARPMALRVERVLGPLVCGHLVTEELAGAENLLEALRRAEATGPPPEPARRRLAAAVGRAIARMHRAGIVHADLNLKNLLVRSAFDRPEVFIVDFDKARLVRHVSAREQRANLERLDRSVRKWPASRRVVGALDRAAVLRAYRTARHPREEG